MELDELIQRQQKLVDECWERNRMFIRKAVLFKKCRTWLPWLCSLPMVLAAGIAIYKHRYLVCAFQLACLVVMIKSMYDLCNGLLKHYRHWKVEYAKLARDGQELLSRMKESKERGFE